MYIKHELLAVEINIEHQFKEFICVKINLANNDKLLIACIYRSASDVENYKLLNDLLLCISKLEESFTHMLITGDFNFRNINWERWEAKDMVSQNFLECVRDCYLEQIVEQPTRYRVNQEPSWRWT